jgi:hypothetical protein
MHRQSIVAVCAALLPPLLFPPSPAVAGPMAPPNHTRSPASNGQTPAQSAAQDMMVVYEEFCLNRFPDRDSFAAGLPLHHATKLDDKAAESVLLGHQGNAWTVVGLEGSYTVALEALPARRCVVTGKAAEDEGVQTVFNMLVSSFANGHEFGALGHRPVVQGNVGTSAATMQLITAAPDGRPRQAFVNMGVVESDGSTRLRLTRELAPK